MKVDVHPAAAVEADTADAWWRAHRADATDAFARELADALELLSRAPEMAPTYRRQRGRVVRRLLLPTSRYHLYYVVETSPARVVVLAVHGAVRGRGPHITG